MTQKPDWIGAEKFILGYIDKTPGEQEQAKTEAVTNFCLNSKSPLNKILSEEKRKRSNEIKKAEKEKQNEIKKAERKVSAALKQKQKLTKKEREQEEKIKEKKAEEIIIEELSEEATRDELALGQLAMNYLKSEDFDKASEILVKDFLKKNHVNTIRHDKQDEIWIYYKGIYIPHGKTFVREYLRKILGEYYYKWFAYRVIDKVSVDSLIDQEEFFKEQNPDYVCVQNGILNIKTRELSPFTPDMKFFSKMPMDWNEKAKCPNIINFFKEILEHEEEQKVIQEIFGFLLYRDYFLEHAFMFKGSGRNGKSKTLSLMKTFLGVDCVAEIPLEEIEKDMFAVSELHKKSANLCGDLSKTAIKNSGAFKKLTGRDLLTAARKYYTRVKFVNYAKMIFAANELPLTSDISDAFFNRWIILTFPYQFLEQKEIDGLNKKEKQKIKLQNPNILSGLTTQEELEGLLVWAVEGLDRIISERTFSYSPSTKSTKNEWLRCSSSFLAFCMDCIEPSPVEFITKEKLRQEYQMYCMENKLKSASDKEIYTILTENYGCSTGQKKINLEYERVWVGIATRRMI